MRTESAGGTGWGRGPAGQSRRGARFCGLALTAPARPARTELLVLGGLDGACLIGKAFHRVGGSTWAVPGGGLGEGGRAGSGEVLRLLQKGKDRL